MSHECSSIRKVVVGVDGSEGSAAALRWATRLAAVSGAEVVAVHVIETSTYDIRPLGLPRTVLNEGDWREEIRDELAVRWCAALTGAGVRHRVRVEEGRAGPRLAEVAEQEQADVLVTGHRGLSGLEELVHGSVSVSVTHHAPCPVVVMPADPDAGSPAHDVGDVETKRAPAHRIVVGVDGGDAAARALHWAIDLATLLDAEVVAVYALQLPSYLLPRPGAASWMPDMENWRRSLHQDFERSWCAPLAAAGVRYQTVFETGAAGDALLREAEARMADLIVTGSRGRGELVELLAGSTSQRVVHGAHCPVVVVPPARVAATAATA